MQELLKELTERIKVRDGIAVTAKVWEQAHIYHRLNLQAHLLFGHGSGIIMGLNVHAESQPGNRRIWISPGIAVDPQGQAIILEEQDSHIVDTSREGLIYLFLEATKEAVIESKNGDLKKEPLRVRQGYVVETALSLPPNAVEIARIRIWGRNAAITNARNPDLPQLNEIDLRFRQLTGSTAKQQVKMSISYIGQSAAKNLPNYEAKAGHFARALEHLTAHHVLVDDEVPLVYDLVEDSDLLYLIEHPYAKLNKDEIDTLQSYLQKGGTLFVETYQPTVPAQPLYNLLPGGGGIQFTTLPSDHNLLLYPFPFATPPIGANPHGKIQVGESRQGGYVIHSTYQHGWLWQRRHQDGRLPSREEIRSAMEWAANIINFVAARQQREN